MNYECFDVDLHNHVAHFSLKRPEKRNSMIPAFWRELPALIEALDQSGDTRAIIISSTGPDFTSGIDLSVFTGEGSASGGAADTVSAAHFYQTVKTPQQSFTVSAKDDLRL